MAKFTGIFMDSVLSRNTITLLQKENLQQGILTERSYFEWLNQTTLSLTNTNLTLCE